jgi:pilus assembly protein Flp/PilA
MKTIMRFLRDEQGLELSEYAVMVGLIVVITVAIITLIGGNINRIFGLLNDALTTVG